MYTVGSLIAFLASNHEIPIVLPVVNCLSFLFPD